MNLVIHTTRRQSNATLACGHSESHPHPLWLALPVPVIGGRSVQFSAQHRHAEIRGGPNPWGRARRAVQADVPVAGLAK
eukprot:SAG11_NODE_5930_length_1431_cov_1.328829_1_plen_79_part_00